MGKRYNLLEAFVGGVVLCISILFVLFFYQISGSSIKNGYMIYAVFDRIDGISVGGDVKISGVRVGKISSLEVDEKTYQAKVGILLKDQMHLTKDTTAEVASASLLGEKYISLVPGGDKQFLQTGDTITDTQSSISFEKLIGKFLFSSK